MMNINSHISFNNAIVNIQEEFLKALNEALTTFFRGNVSSVSFDEVGTILMKYNGVQSYSLRTNTFVLKAYDDYHLTIISGENERAELFDKNLVEKFKNLESSVKQYLDDDSRIKMAALLKTDVKPIF